VNSVSLSPKILNNNKIYMKKEELYDEIYNKMPWNDDSRTMNRAMMNLALVTIDSMMKLVYDNWYDSTNGVFEELQRVRAEIKDDLMNS
jgi:hypothetical protein